MTGYAAFGHVERGRVREPNGRASPEAWTTSVEPARVDERAPAALRPPDGLEARLTRLRESWAMTTFYLFDPDSWR
jgi:hypothetical protein